MLELCRTVALLVWTVSQLLMWLVMFSSSTGFTQYPGSQVPFWGEEVTSPAIVGLNTILVRLCHPIEGLGGLLTILFWHDG